VITRLIGATIAGLSGLIAIALAVSWASTPARDVGFFPTSFSSKSLDLRLDISADGVGLTATAVPRHQGLISYLSNGVSLRDLAAAAMRQPAIAQGGTCQKTRLLDIDDATIKAGENDRLSAEGKSTWISVLSDDVIRLCFFDDVDFINRLNGNDDVVRGEERLIVGVTSASVQSVIPEPDEITRSRGSAELIWSEGIPKEIEIRLELPQEVVLRRLPMFGPGLLFSWGPIAALIALTLLGLVTVLVPAGLVGLRSAQAQPESPETNHVDRLLGTAFALALMSIFLSAAFQVDEFLSDLRVDSWTRIVVILVGALSCAAVGSAAARRRTQPWRSVILGATTAAAAAGAVVAATRAIENAEIPDVVVRLASWIAVAALVYLVLEVVADAISWLVTRHDADEWVTVSLLGLSLLLAVPTGPSSAFEYLNAIGLLTIAVPALSVLAAMIMARAHASRARFEALALAPSNAPFAGHRTFIGLLFALVVVGPSGRLFGLPLALLVALALIQFVLQPPQRIAVLVDRAASLRGNRKTSIPKLVGPPESDGAAIGQAGSEPRATWLSPFTIGVYSRPWLNALFAVRWGLLLAGVPLIVSLTLSLPTIVSDVEPLLLLRVGLSATSTTLHWLGVALVFGLGFELIRGQTGIRKGLWMGFLAAVATGPFSLIELLTGRVDGLHAVTDQALLIAFLAVLGLAFDLKVSHRYAPKVRGLRSTVERVADTSGFREVGAAVVAVVVAVSLQLQTALAGQVTTFLQSGLAALTQAQ
jgi:hypothetical protein